MNNLLQREIFSKRDFDRLARNLINPEVDGNSWISHLFAHRIPLIGCYDCDLICFVLDSLSLKHHFVTLDNLHASLASCAGFILNRKGKAYLRHWFCLRYVRGVLYNLDSNLECPDRFISVGQAEQWIREVLASDPHNMMIAVEGSEDDLLARSMLYVTERPPPAPPDDPNEA
eukprot:gnl/Trimastix_PCT/1940.p2 GENE.gnl/Trimastix_PCT/1940~~gnl/Trimastix_PCT/1940.p2  ORF type:complete len:173 (+),score=9.83 gnl/Trimastix_PCT/1940:200-718(+)